MLVQGLVLEPTNLRKDLLSKFLVVVLYLPSSCLLSLTKMMDFESLALPFSIPPLEQAVELKMVDAEAVEVDLRSVSTVADCA